LWDQAKTFCGWIGGRLPTAEEWEYAAKSGGSRIYPWGNAAITGKLANYCDKNCWATGKDADQDDGYAATAPVGSYPAGATAWGLFDMTGNVREWTSTVDPRFVFANELDNEMEVRGGSFRTGNFVLRASGHDVLKRNVSDGDAGMRCALAALPAPASSPDASSRAPKAGRP
jgi:formylglycine-generating enzyme required for sulfatase activity